MSIPKNEPSTSFILGAVFLICAAFVAAATWPLYLDQKEDVELVTVEGILRDVIFSSHTHRGTTYYASLRIEGHPKRIQIEINKSNQEAINKPGAYVKTFKHVHYPDGLFSFGESPAFGLWVGEKEVLSYAYSKSRHRSGFSGFAFVTFIFFAGGIGSFGLGWHYLKRARAITARADAAALTAPHPASPGRRRGRAGR